MNNDLSSYFEDPEFKEALEKYEGMVKNHTPAYFDADELTDIAEYRSRSRNRLCFTTASQRYGCLDFSCPFPGHERQAGRSIYGYGLD